MLGRGLATEPWLSLTVLLPNKNPALQDLGASQLVVPGFVVQPQSQLRHISSLLHRSLLIDKQTWSQALVRGTFSACVSDMMCGDASKHVRLKRR